ncbi:hypothetical protein M409DRAFT_66535 [Zasmidium cellare ATCC 36951]|uniref:Uncharacterized protein n=1 Tax=Zasmidium cellare ATCC 36951 TaxID=1080233 RepID=A0A6A6CJW0_ZASCE|nr:uncharacterized protein M409DRAFT_66535 [Zasmidium cellare ATCC 36951]KAF2166488.1 hypothetical protein M409DRAFT_66535 [Zasmidium cellare ATCC 36951]
MTALPGETYRLAFPTLPDIENPPWVSYGRSHHEACAHHVKNTYNAKRAYIIASGSLSRNTDEVEKLKIALGDRLAGVYPGFKPHTPWDEVLEASKDAKEKGADCMITIGGGSLVDGAKAMLLFMANNTTTIPEIYDMHKIAPAALNKMGTLAKDIDIVSPTMPLICIPTTLSGGEYSCYGGGTHPETHHKLVLGHPFMGPRLIINDPKLSITAPEWVWLSTGVRAIDHCVESYCRMFKEDDTDADEATLEAFKKIVPNLLITKKDWTNEEARLNTMLGVNLVLIILRKAIMPGASHGIGHQLGPLGVGHGQTSCILLPSVMKYNAKVNGAKQEKLKAFMWNEPAVAKVLESRGLWKESSDAGDALDAIFRELGMPRTLKEVNVGRDKFDALAVNSLTDPCCHVNPIPMERKEQVLEILEMCAG